MKRLREGLVFVLAIAAICLVSVGRAPAATKRRHHPTARVAAIIVERCALKTGAFIAAPDGVLGGDAWWIDGHFEWGYVENGRGRVVGLILVLRQGSVPWRRFSACLRPSGLVGSGLS